MKTSKKILSFFLAVVMVVTTCSVGFSAFAAEKNKSIWSTDCEADEAYAAIGGLVDQYVPSLLMGILGDNVEPIYKKYAGDYGTTADQLTDAQKEDIKNNKATVSDILEALSPVIANVDLFGMKMSKADFMEEYKSIIGSGVADDYNYLDTAEEGTIDFYTMYNLCAKILSDKSVELSDEARAELESWYETLNALAGKYREKIALLNGLQDSAVEIAKRSGADKYSSLSLAELKAVNYVFTHEEAQGDEMVTVDDTETVKEFIKYTVAQNNSKFAENLIPESDSLNDQFAAALYYTVGMGENLIKVAPYDHLLELAKASVDLVDASLDFTIDGDTKTVVCNATGLTGKNAVDKLGDAVLAAFGLEDNAINRSKADAAIVKTYCDKIILPANLDSNSDYYCDFIKGAVVLSGAYTLDEYNAILKARPQSDTVLTTAQLRTIGNELKAASFASKKWDVEKMKTYFTDPTNTFGSYYGNTAVVDFILYYLDNEMQETLIKSWFGATAWSNGLIAPNNTTYVEYQKFLSGVPYFTNVQIAKSAFDDQYIEENNRLNCFELFRLQDVSDTAGYRNGYIRDYAEAHLDYTISVELEENEKYKASDYNLASPTGVEVVNAMINSTINGFIPTIEGLFNVMPTRLNLDTAIMNIYKRAYDNATQTVFELLPVIVALLDEGLLPAIINNVDDIGSAEGTGFRGFQQTISMLVPNIIGLIAGGNHQSLASTELRNNAALGMTAMTLDLNTILPNVLHWLYEGDAAAEKLGFIYYRDYTGSGFDGTDKPVPLKNGSNIRNFIINTDYDYELFSLEHLSDYDAIDQDGYELTYNGETISYRNHSYSDLDAVAADYPDAVFNYYKTFKGNVPMLTGIYALDELLSGFSMKDISVMLSLLVGGDAGKAVGEAVTEIGTLLMVAIDEFLADPELADAVKIDAEGLVVCKGLNNILVALPQLFDIIENLAADKYGVDKDAWVYCYEGKIEKDGNAVCNTLLERFKSYASSSDSDRAKDILDCFAEILIENWLDAILSLLNNVIATDNEIANNLPIVAGLLNSIGGLGEQSILTDILNSVFQLTRDSEYSFTLSANHSDPNNKLTGLSKQNAYFLLSNIDRLVEVITNLIAHFGGGEDSDDSNNENKPSSPSPVLKITPAASAAATSHNYSANDLSNTKDLIGNLDNMLSSLLSDSTINDFSLNSTENLLAGVVSLLDKFLGNDVKLDKALTTDIVVLVNQYLYFITGESDNLTADGKKVNAKKVYSNDALTGLVVETYALIEKIADRLLNHKDGLMDLSDVYNIGNNETAKYNLLVEAIDGIIAPDAISVRLGDYGNAQEKFAETKYTTWTDMSEASSRNNYKNLRVDWGFKDGNKEGFYEGLSASLRLVTSILGVLFIETGWYDTVLTPILGALCDKNGIELESYETLKADADATGYYDKTFLAIITPVSEWLNALLNAPAATLIKSIQGLAGVIDDNNTKAGTIKSIVNGLIDPIKNELRGAGKIFAIKSDKLLPTSLTLQKIINNLVDTKLSNLEFDINGTALKINSNGIAVNGCQITGNNLIPIINTALAGTGIKLKQISWSKIYSSTPEAALVYVLEYVIENLIDNDNLDVLVGLINNDIFTTIVDLFKSGQLTAVDFLNLINRVLEITDTPTLAYWTFAQYLQELAENFKYPAGITKAMADKGVDTLDNLVKNIFPLLGSFGVNLGANDLKGILDANLFKNELLTKFAVTLYSALDGLDPTIKSVLKGLGIVTSTKDVANLLTDSSYGTTFSSAANTIKAQSSWKNVKNVNWGFTDGSAKAQQGFVNAFVAILRPLNDVLNVFLNEGALHLDEVAYEAITSITVAPTTQKIEVSGNIVIEMTISMNNGVVTIKIDDAVREKSAASTIKLDLRSLKNADDLKIEGTNGYNSAIIPLLEAFQCLDVKTYSQYRSDVNKAKDNLLLDILNPIAGASSNSLLNRLVDAPFSVLTDLLPNIAMYLDAQGLLLLVSNLLAPITGILGDTQDVAALADEVINLLLGDSLENAIIPLVNGILADNGINIELPDINWNALISLGDKLNYTSAATGADGKYLIGKIVGNVDQGKVLITVLRYIAQVLTDNASSLKALILGIDGLKNNKNYDMIASILTSVFNTIGTASADQIVVAIFYLVSSEPTNAFWDYTKYKTGQYSFAYPESMDVDFLKNLPPMLDGLVSGLVDLNGLISENLFTDSLVSKLAKGLYGAVEGVKVGDGSLTALLAQTDIDFSTTNVANLLVNKDYGQTFEGAASVIRNAGSWKNVNADSLKWGVTDRDSFFHALVAVLRPLYGVLDVLLNDADLGLFNLIRIPGSNGYTSSIVPLMEAFSMYNIKTQYQYREDINKEYDAILLDIINPIWDKVEDILNAPIQTLMAVIPNLALFIGNDGLCQIIDNLLTPVSALVDALRPIVDLNDLLNTLLPALGVNLNSLLGKIGITNFSLDIYDLNKTLKQVLGGDAIIPLVNNILGIIKIGGTPLGLKLNAVDWLQLASHGTTIVSASQAATYGSRIFVEGDSSETLIAFLRYLINTINAGDNFDKISSLIGGLLGDNVASNVSDIISQVLGMLQGDTDEVISSLVELLQTLA